MTESSTAGAAGDHAAAVPLQPLVDPAGWDPRAMEKSEAWIYRLSNEEIGEVIDAARRLDIKGADLPTVRSDDFLLPGFGGRLTEIRDELMNGRGFALLRGLPIERMTKAQFAKAFWVSAPISAPPSRRTSKANSSVTSKIRAAPIWRIAPIRRALRCRSIATAAIFSASPASIRANRAASTGSAAR